jgi:hypothetical protein
MWSLSELIVAIITVLQLPPRLSFSIVVIREFLYGICYRLKPFIFSFRAIITYSKYVRDRFMYLASLNAVPSIYDLEALSDPAKSTRWSLLMKQVSDPFSFPSSVTVNTQCDLDEH